MGFDTVVGLLKAAERDTYVLEGEVMWWMPNGGIGEVQVLSGKFFCFPGSTWSGWRFPRVGDKVNVVFGSSLRPLRVILQ